MMLQVEQEMAVANTPKIALRLMLAHVIGGGRWWRVEPEPQRPATTAIGEAIVALPTQAAFADLRKMMIQLLGLDKAEPAIVRHDHDAARTATVFARLLELSDKDVMRILAVTMAETLAAGTVMIDTLGAMLSLDVGQHWRADETFLALVRDREAVNTMLAEVIGESAGYSYLTEAASKKKAIIRKALAGEGRAKVEVWTPRYMAFPQRGYTSRDLQAVLRSSA